MHTCKSINPPPQNTRNVYHVKAKEIIFCNELRKLERLLDPHLRFLDRLTLVTVHEIYKDKLATIPSFAMKEEYSNVWAMYDNTCILKMKIIEWVHFITAIWNCGLSFSLIGAFNLYLHRQQVSNFIESSIFMQRKKCRVLTKQQIVLRDSQQKWWADLEPKYKRPKSFFEDT